MKNAHHIPKVFKNGKSILFGGLTSVGMHYCKWANWGLVGGGSTPSALTRVRSVKTPSVTLSPLEARGLAHGPELVSDDDPSLTPSQRTLRPVPRRQPMPQALGYNLAQELVKHPKPNRYGGVALSARSTGAGPYRPLSRQGHTTSVTQQDKGFTNSMGEGFQGPLFSPCRRGLLVG